MALSFLQKRTGAWPALCFGSSLSVILSGQPQEGLLARLDRRPLVTLRPERVLFAPLRPAQPVKHPRQGRLAFATAMDRGGFDRHFRCPIRQPLYFQRLFNQSQTSSNV